MRQTRLPVTLAVAITCWCVTASAPAYSQETTLWQMGAFDQPSEEFGLSFGFGALTGTQLDPVYRVGQSNWKKDWSGFQPGSANGRAGGREPNVAPASCRPLLKLSRLEAGATAALQRLFQQPASLASLLPLKWLDAAAGEMLKRKSAPRIHAVQLGDFTVPVAQ